MMVPLEDLVQSLATVENELGFQVNRLNDLVTPRTGSEEEYHDNLKKGYANAQYWIGILKRYHQGRLTRQRASETMVEDHGIEQGVAVAHAEDEDA